MESGNTVLDNAVLLRLSFSRAGNVRKGDLGKVQCDADKERLKLGKVLYVSEQYAAVQAFDNALGAWVSSRAILADTGMRGVSILPRALLGDVDKRLQAAEVERAALVDKFMVVYDAEREKGRERLNGQFRESDYPPADEVRASFGLRWSYIQFGAADGLPPEIAERERNKLRERFSEVEADVREALRVGLRDLVAHLSERLKPGPDGKRQIFRDSAVENLRDFLTLFAARNVTRDGELASLAEKAQAVIRNADPQRLRDSVLLRDGVRSELESVKASIDGLISSQPRRKFNLED
jgi:hypothetical protein